MFCFWGIKISFILCNFQPEVFVVVCGVDIKAVYVLFPQNKLYRCVISQSALLFLELTLSLGGNNLGGRKVGNVLK